MAAGMRNVLCGSAERSMFRDELADFAGEDEEDAEMGEASRWFEIASMIEEGLLRKEEELRQQEEELRQREAALQLLLQRNNICKQDLADTVPTAARLRAVLRCLGALSERVHKERAARRQEPAATRYHPFSSVPADAPAAAAASPTYTWPHQLLNPLALGPLELPPAVPLRLGWHGTPGASDADSVSATTTSSATRTALRVPDRCLPRATVLWDFVAWWRFFHDQSPAPGAVGSPETTDAAAAAGGDATTGASTATAAVVLRGCYRVEAGSVSKAHPPPRAGDGTNDTHAAGGGRVCVFCSTPAGASWRSECAGAWVFDFGSAEDAVRAAAVLAAEFEVFTTHGAGDALTGHGEGCKHCRYRDGGATASAAQLARITHAAYLAGRPSTRGALFARDFPWPAKSVRGTWLLTPQVRLPDMRYPDPARAAPAPTAYIILTIKDVDDNGAKGNIVVYTQLPQPPEAGGKQADPGAGAHSYSFVSQGDAGARVLTAAEADVDGGLWQLTVETVTGTWDHWTQMLSLATHADGEFGGAVMNLRAGLDGDALHGFAGAPTHAAGRAGSFAPAGLAAVRLGPGRGWESGGDDAALRQWLHELHNDGRLRPARGGPGQAAAAATLQYRHAGGWRAREGKNIASVAAVTLMRSGGAKADRGGVTRHLTTWRAPPPVRLYGVFTGGAPPAAAAGEDTTAAAGAAPGDAKCLRCGGTTGMPFCGATGEPHAVQANDDVKFILTATVTLLETVVADPANADLRSQQLTKHTVYMMRTGEHRFEAVPPPPGAAAFTNLAATPATPAPKLRIVLIKEVDVQAGCVLPGAPWTAIVVAAADGRGACEQLATKEGGVVGRYARRVDGDEKERDPLAAEVVEVEVEDAREQAQTTRAGGGSGVVSEFAMAAAILAKDGIAAKPGAGARQLPSNLSALNPEAAALLRAAFEAVANDDDIAAAEAAAPPAQRPPPPPQAANGYRCGGCLRHVAPVALVDDAAAAHCPLCGSAKSRAFTTWTLTAPALGRHTTLATRRTPDGAVTFVMNPLDACASGGPAAGGGQGTQRNYFSRAAKIVDTPTAVEIRAGINASTLRLWAPAGQVGTVHGILEDATGARVDVVLSPAYSGMASAAPPRVAAVVRAAPAAAGLAASAGGGGGGDAVSSTPSPPAAKSSKARQSGARDSDSPSNSLRPHRPRAPGSCDDDSWNRSLSTISSGGLPDPATPTHSDSTDSDSAKSGGARDAAADTPLASQMAAPAYESCFAEKLLPLLSRIIKCAKAKSSRPNAEQRTHDLIARASEAYAMIEACRDSNKMSAENEEKVMRAALQLQEHLKSDDVDPDVRVEAAGSRVAIVHELPYSSAEDSSEELPCRGGVDTAAIVGGGAANDGPRPVTDTASEPLAPPTGGAARDAPPEAADAAAPSPAERPDAAAAANAAPDAPKSAAPAASEPAPTPPKAASSAPSTPRAASGKKGKAAKAGNKAGNAASNAEAKAAPAALAAAVREEVEAEIGVGVGRGLPRRRLRASVARPLRDAVQDLSRAVEQLGGVRAGDAGGAGEDSGNVLQTLLSLGDETTLAAMLATTDPLESETDALAALLKAGDHPGLLTQKEKEELAELDEEEKLARRELETLDRLGRLEELKSTGRDGDIDARIAALFRGGDTCDLSEDSAGSSVDNVFRAQSYSDIDELVNLLPCEDILGGDMSLSLVLRCGDTLPPPPALPLQQLPPTTTDGVAPARKPSSTAAAATQNPSKPLRDPLQWSSVLSTSNDRSVAQHFMSVVAGHASP